MIGWILLFCALPHSSVTNNVTLNEIAEAYKYFEAAHSKNNDVTPREPYKLPQLPPKDVLAVIHDLRPYSQGLAADIKTLPPLLESREISLEDDQQTSKQNTTPTPISEREQRRNFLSWIQNLFSGGSGNKKSKKKSNATQPVTKKVTTTTTKAPKKNRRMMEWFKNLFKGTPVITTTELNNPEVLNTELFDIIANITVVFNKLHDVLQKLNENIAEERKVNRNNAYFVLKFPVTPKTDTDVHYRRKRDTKTTQKYAKNDTEIENEVEIITEGPELSTKQTRRTTNEIAKDSLKFKLLAHLADSFKEIKEKIAPLAYVKELHSSRDDYKIGYIAASVDTLEANLNKLMKELQKNKYVWDETKILEFFDKLKTSNHVLRNLMKYLDVLTQRNQQVYGVKEEGVV